MYLHEDVQPHVFHLELVIHTDCWIIQLITKTEQQQMHYTTRVKIPKCIFVTKTRGNSHMYIINEWKIEISETRFRN